MSAKKVNKITNKKSSVDVQKRAFMKKFGEYTVAGAGIAVLMTPTSSSAGCYNTGNPGHDGGGSGCGTENSGRPS